MPIQQGPRAKIEEGGPLREFTDQRTDAYQRMSVGRSLRKPWVEEPNEICLSRKPLRIPKESKNAHENLCHNGLMRIRASSLDSDSSKIKYFYLAGSLEHLTVLGRQRVNFNSNHIYVVWQEESFL